MLALAVLASGQMATFAADTKPAPSLRPLQKARAIMIQIVHYESLPLSEVLKHLCNETKKRDPEGKGIKISLAENARDKSYTSIKLDLKNVSLADALGSIAQIARLRVQETDTEIILAPTGRR